MPLVPVACGVVMGQDGRVLVTQRPLGKIAAGKWEFPGGKIEAGESPLEALRRELCEELGLETLRARPLIRLIHDYCDRRVSLDVWCVDEWSGTVQGHDHQAWTWARPEQLRHLDLLAADAPIVTALQLPRHYVFTPPKFSWNKIVEGMGRLPASALLRLRMPDLSDGEYSELAAAILPHARTHGIRLILDRDAAMVERLGADGWHRSSRYLERFAQRPRGFLFASCHSDEEVEAAKIMGADAVVIGSILQTKTHATETPLGWTRFSQLALHAGLPAYAIGGMRPDDLARSEAFYAQGLAGISAYWEL